MRLKLRLRTVWFYMSTTWPFLFRICFSCRHLVNIPNLIFLVTPIQQSASLCHASLFMVLLELRNRLHKYNCMNESFGCFLFLVRGIFTENHKIRDWWQESQYSDEMDTTDKYRPWSGSATNGPLKRTSKSRTSCHSGYRLRDWCDDMATWGEIFPIS